MHLVRTQDKAVENPLQLKNESLNTYVYRTLYSYVALTVIPDVKLLILPSRMHRLL